MLRIYSFLIGLYFVACAEVGIFNKNFKRENYQIYKIVIFDQKALINANWKITEINGIIDTSAMPNKFYNVYNGLELVRSDIVKNSSNEHIREINTLLKKAFLNFDQTNRKISGIIACNNFSSNFEWKNEDTITIQNQASTRKICQIPGLNELENVFSSNINGDFRVLTFPSGIVLKKPDVEIYLK